MFSRGFGGLQGMGVASSAGEFEQMARQYWTAWEQALRGAVPGAAQPSVQPGGQAWQEALQSWTDVFAHRPLTNDVMARFGQQARQWYAQIQQVASRFGDQPGQPAEIVEAWKTALGGVAVNPLQSLLDSMNGPGMQGMDQWLRGVQPLLDTLTGKHHSWFNLPAFGFTREHQERLQALVAAQFEVQQATQAYQEVMAEASRAAFQRFEQRLSALQAEGREISTPRALFDVWVDVAEDAYAEVALSARYRSAYGTLLNAQIRLRAGIQGEVERFCSQLGMPTRTEIDGAHRKIVELERELRRLRDLGERTVTPAPAVTPEPAPTPAPVPPRPKAAKAAPKALKNAAPFPAKPAPAKAAKAVKKTAPARKPRTTTASK